MKHRYLISACLSGALGALALVFTGCGVEGVDASDPPAPADVEKNSQTTVTTVAPDSVPIRASDPLALPRQTLSVFSAGANRLSDLQADITGDNARDGLVDTDPDDGGWDWELTAGQPSHSVPASPENVFGATAFGLWATQNTPARDPRFATALWDTYLGMKNRPEVDSPPDFVFLVALSTQVSSADAPALRDLARQRYDAKLVQYGGPQGIVSFIRNFRHVLAHDEGLIPYDLGFMILSAQALHAVFPDAGYHSHVRTYAEAVVNDLKPGGAFDINNPHQNFYAQGLAWAALSIARGGVGRALLLPVGTKLLQLQLADGSWPWNGDHVSGDNEATALAVQGVALAAQALPPSYPGVKLALSAARRGSRWLISQQLPTGGWTYDSGLENPLVTGEALLALYLLPPGSFAPRLPRLSSPQPSAQSDAKGGGGGAAPAPRLASPILF